MARSQRSAVCISALLLLLGSQSPAQAQLFVTHCWTAVGSAGVVDEEDTGKVLFDFTSAGVRPSVLNGTVDLHYSVVAVDGVFGGPQKILRARIADNGPTARVIVKIRQTSLDTGVSKTLTTIDSDALGLPTSGAHKVERFFGSGSTDFNFVTNVYWIDVQLTKLVTSGNPRVEAIQICPSTG